MQERGKQEVENIEDEEEDEDGPPPGFQCIIAPQQQITHVQKVEVENEDEDDDEGPPPGFDSIPSKQPPSLPYSDMEKSSRHQDIDDDDDDDDDDDGPPPGWELSSLAHALPKPLPNTTDIKSETNEKLNKGEYEDEDEDEDEGPPPGWEIVLPHKMSPPCTPPLQTSSAVSSDIDMGSKQEIPRNDDDAPQSVSQRSSPPTPPLQKLPSSALPGEIRIKEDDPKTGEKGPKSGKQSASPKQMLPPAPHPPTPPAAAPSSSEKAQLVCGTCRKLLLYPRGAKWVQCPGCQEVNFVLEAHEVGQVKCGGCTTLLMYPYGAPAVQCSSCRSVTEIGPHNMRPPLSVQQAQSQRRRRPRRAR